MRKQIVIGFLGTTLDAGDGPKRWERWRPTVSLCQHEDLLVDRLELLHDQRNAPMLARLVDDIRQISPETDIRPRVLNLQNPWDFEEVYAALHDFALAYPFDTDTEDYLIQITTGTHVAQICMFLLTEARYFPARLLQLSPPRRNQGQNPGNHAVIDLDLSRYDRIATRFHAEHEEAASFLKSGIPTRNAAFNRMIGQIEQVAIRSSAPVLLTGPTGAGKSHLARRIYELKRARHQIDGPFVEVNCATLRGDNAMSTLFGHVKGAFTGAINARTGLLRSADGGMLFLDEIGELGADEQAMILRAVEEKRFLPVGSDKEAESDFQLIAGTNRALARDVHAGRFREDLFARLNLWTYHLPGLRDRPEDIEPNLDYELRRFDELNGQHVTFNKEGRRRYLAFATAADAVWSANFRDLAASITRMGTLAPAGRITEEIVVEEIERLRRAWATATDTGDETSLAAVIDIENLARIDLFDRVQLAEVVRVCRASPSLSAAGRTLFAASREQRKTTNDADRLRKYLAKFGLDWATIGSSG